MLATYVKRLGSLHLFRTSQEQRLVVHLVSGVLREFSAHTAGVVSIRPVTMTCFR